MISARFIEPWTAPTRGELEIGPGLRAVQIVFGCLFVALIVGAVVLARRNLRLGRSDTRGAARVAVVVMTGLALEWVLCADHSVAEEVGFLVRSVSNWLLVGGLIWLIYAALEPFLRRRWPGTLISWNRLLIGRFRDPLVGRDVLIGATACMASGLLWKGVGLAAQLWWLAAPPIPDYDAGQEVALLGGRHAIGLIIASPTRAILMTLALLFVLLFLRVILRKPWLAFGVFVVIGAVPAAFQWQPPFLFVAFALQLIMWTILLLLLSRVGLLSVCSFWTCTFLWGNTSNLPGWNASSSAMMALTMLALAAYGFYTSVAGRPLFRGKLVPEVEAS